MPVSRCPIFSFYCKFQPSNIYMCPGFYGTSSTIWPLASSTCNSHHSSTTRWKHPGHLLSFLLRICTALYLISEYPPTPPEATGGPPKYFWTQLNVRASHLLLFSSPLSWLLAIREPWPFLTAMGGGTHINCQWTMEGPLSYETSFLIQFGMPHSRGGAGKVRGLGPHMILSRVRSSGPLPYTKVEIL